MRLCAAQVHVPGPCVVGPRAPAVHARPGPQRPAPGPAAAGDEWDRPVSDFSRGKDSELFSNIKFDRKKSGIVVRDDGPRRHPCCAVPHTDIHASAGK